MEGRLARNLSEFIPRTDFETLVAAVNAVADGGAEFHRDAAFVLDGEVGDAASRIHSVRGGDGLGRAGNDATRARPAVVF